MINQVLELLEEKKYAQARNVIEEMNAVDVAAIFAQLEERETIVKLFRILPKELAAEAFAYMEPDIQQNVIEAISDKELSYILDEMYMDDYMDLLGEMPANVVKRLIKNASEETRGLINQFLNYPEDSAGSIMTIEYVDLKRHLTVQQAFDHIRKTGVDKETIYTCYVTDENRVLEGVVTAKELLLADPNEIVGNIMSTNVIYVQTLDDKEQIAKLFSKYDMLSLPVVDKETRLVGIITIDDAVDVMQEENTEDFEIMAAISPTDESYLKTPVFTHVRKRILWLLILMLSAMITGQLITHYEDAFAAIPLLVSFIPMLMDTGGNCGSQSSTMVIRGMALDEIQMKDFFRVWFKEIRIALVCGIILSVVNTLRIWIQYGDFFMAITVGITLLITVIIAKSLGCILPMLAKALHLDPAVMASPLITTIVDVCSVFVFFNMAIWILHV